MSEDYELIQQLATYDVAVLEEKGKTYGDSWRRRGGAGAFMMLARKWDRIENIAQGAGYDIFAAAAPNTGDILDDIADLRRYLLLVEAHVAGTKEEEEAHRKWTLRPGADPDNPKAGDWVKVEEEDCGPGPGGPRPVCPECRKDVLSDSTVVYRKGECPIHGEEDCGPGAGYVNQDPDLKPGPWTINRTSDTMPQFELHDEVLQVKWKDGTHSTILAWEFLRHDVPMKWADVCWYRVIPYGCNAPAPEPVKKWGEVSAPAPHAGSHQHTINVGHHPLDVPAQPSYSHSTLAGIASAVSGINAAVSAMPKV